MLSVSYDTTILQTHGISQHQIQFLKILAMDVCQLSEYIQELALENPIIEIDTPLTVCREEPVPQSCLIGGKKRSCAPDSGDMADIWNVLGSGEESLAQSLKIQLKDDAFSESDNAILCYLIDCLNEDGYFFEDLSYIENRFSINHERAEQLLCVVQSLDPPGIGARGLRECLLLQLHRLYPSQVLAYQIADCFLEDLSRNALPVIAKKCGCSLQDAVKACKLIRSLSPRPGASFTDQNEPYIYPDLLVREGKEGFDLLVCNDCLPQFRINPCYQAMLGDSLQEETRLYLLNKQKQACWIQNCVVQRQQTLLRIGMEILTFQKAFFEKGSQYLKPLTQQKVADQLGIHDSTVCRAIHYKYLQCSWGTFPLHYFFSVNMTAHNETGISNTKALIQQLLLEESTDKPLSDHKIAKQITDAGIPVSRRTIAKYREEMEIPNSSARKAYL